MDSINHKLLRLPAVLDRFPVGKTHWLSGVKTGKYPQPVRLTARLIAWRESDIDALIASCEVSA